MLGALRTAADKQDPKLGVAELRNQLGASDYGMAGPKGMDPAIVKKLHDAIKLAMEDPKAIEVRDKFNMVANYMDTPAYAKYQLELYEQEKKYLTDIGLAKKD